MNDTCLRQQVAEIRSKVGTTAEINVGAATANFVILSALTALIAKQSGHPGQTMDLIKEITTHLTTHINQNSKIPASIKDSTNKRIDQFNMTVKNILK